MSFQKTLTKEIKGDTQISEARDRDGELEIRKAIRPDEVLEHALRESRQQQTL